MSTPRTTTATNNKAKPTTNKDKSPSVPTKRRWSDRDEDKTGPSAGVETPATAARRRLLEAPTSPISTGSTATVTTPSRSRRPQPRLRSESPELTSGDQPTLSRHSVPSTSHAVERPVPALSGPSRPLKIASWNINSIRQFINKLASKLKLVSKEGVLEQYFNRNGYDIVCFQEVKLRDPKKELPEDGLNVPGYDAFFCLPDEKTLTERRNYSGVATYVRHGLTRSAERGFGKGPVDAEEGRALTTDHGDFLLINIYAPCPLQKERRGYRSLWMEKLTERVAELRRAKKRVIVVGDFNAAQTSLDVFKRYANDSPKSSTISTLLSHGMLDAWRQLNPGRSAQYTYWSRAPGKIEKNEGWRIDYFLVDEESYTDWVEEAEILSGWTTWAHGDHCPITLHLSLKGPEPNFATPEMCLSTRTRERIGVSDLFERALAASNNAGPSNAGARMAERTREKRDRVEVKPVHPRSQSELIVLEDSQSDLENSQNPGVPTTTTNHARSQSQNSQSTTSSASWKPPPLPPSKQNNVHYKTKDSLKKEPDEEGKKKMWAELAALGVPMAPRDGARRKS